MKKSVIKQFTETLTQDNFLKTTNTFDKRFNRKKKRTYQEKNEEKRK